MKTLCLACLAVSLSASPLLAQTQPAPAASPAPSPAADTAAQADDFLKNPLVQQVMHTVVQKALEFQSSSASGDGKSFDFKSINNFLSGLLGGGSSGDDFTPAERSSGPGKSGFAAYIESRLANEPGQRHFDPTSRTWIAQALSDAERSELITRFQRDYSRLSANEQAQWEAAASDGSTPTLDRWGSILGNTGGLRTGGLRTGGLRTGKLSEDPLPARDFVTPASAYPTPMYSASAASAPSTATTAVASSSSSANLLPADPDEAMRRWNRQVDSQYATEQEARSAAVRQYPDLAVADSAFNAQFRTRYQQYRQSDPFGFLRGPGWPMKLAIFTDGDLKRQQSGTAEKP